MLELLTGIPTKANEITLGLQIVQYESAFQLQKESLMSKICSEWCFIITARSLKDRSRARHTERERTYANIILCLFKTTEQHGQQNQGRACGISAREI